MAYSMQNTIRQKTEMLRVKNQLVRQWGSSVVDHAGMGEDSPLRGSPLQVSERAGVPRRCGEDKQERQYHQTERASERYKFYLDLTLNKINMSNVYPFSGTFPADHHSPYLYYLRSRQEDAETERHQRLLSDIKGLRQRLEAQAIQARDQARMVHEEREKLEEQRERLRLRWQRLEKIE